jgi:REP element-mobilizing transposase RayT
MSEQEFNESHIPLAYLITFRCYGTWLHGDERGSVDREHNVYGAPFLGHDEKWESDERIRLKHAPVELDAARRAVVRAAIREVCAHRKWALLAINVRTNHAHSVVAVTCKPQKVRDTFKAYTTRRMREAGVWKHTTTPWAEKGSGRYLWTEKSVARAIDYVLNHLGDEPPPDFGVENDEPF